MIGIAKKIIKNEIFIIFFLILKLFIYLFL